MSEKSAIDELFGSAEPSKFLDRYLAKEIVEFPHVQSKGSDEIEDIKSDHKQSKIEEEERIKRTLFLGNLPASVTSHQITSLVGKKNVENVRIRSIALSNTKKELSRQVAVRRHLVDGNGTCCAYVVMKSPEDVEEAIKKFNSYNFMDHVIRADHATLKGEKNVIDKDTNKRSVFIGHVPFDATEEEIRDIFKECGEIHHVRIPRDERGKSRGVAYVTFVNEDDVALALQFNGADFRKEKITVERSNPARAEKLKRKKEEKENKKKGAKLAKKDKPKGKFGNRKKQYKPKKDTSAKTDKGDGFEGRRSKPKLSDKNQAIRTYIKMRAHINKKRRNASASK